MHKYKMAATPFNDWKFYLKLGTRVIPHFYVFLSGKSISGNNMMIRGRFKGQKVNLNINHFYCPILEHFLFLHHLFRKLS